MRVRNHFEIGESLKLDRTLYKTGNNQTVDKRLKFEKSQKWTSIYVWKALFEPFICELGEIYSNRLVAYLFLC